MMLYSIRLSLSYKHATKGICTKGTHKVDLIDRTLVIGPQNLHLGYRIYFCLLHPNVKKLNNLISKCFKSASWAPFSVVLGILNRVSFILWISSKYIYSYKGRYKNIIYRGTRIVNFFLTACCTSISKQNSKLNI